MSCHSCFLLLQKSHDLPAISQSTSAVNSNFNLTKNSSHRETISYICGLRTRIGCEPFSEHSTHSDRVTNIGYRLPVGASVLLTQITIYLSVGVSFTTEKGRYAFSDQQAENILPFPVMQSIVINPIQNT